MIQNTLVVSHRGCLSNLPYDIALITIQIPYFNDIFYFYIMPKIKFKF